MTDEILVQPEQGKSDKEIIDAFYGEGTPIAQTLGALAVWEQKNKGVLLARKTRLTQVKAAQRSQKTSGYDNELEFSDVKKPLVPALTFLVDRVNDLMPTREDIVGKKRGATKAIHFTDFDNAVEKLQPFLENLKAAGQYLSPKQ